MRSILALLCWMSIPVAASAQDFQFWNEIDFTAGWKKIDFLVPVVARTDTRLPNPQLVATGITADVPLPWHLTLTGGYLFADLPHGVGGVHLPLIAVSTGFHAGRLTLIDRNRFEKLVGYGTSPVRYRNRFLLDYPVSRGHIFASDEIIFNVSAGNWNQNRLQAGGGLRLNPRLAVDVYFLQRDASGSAPRSRVIGTTLKIALTKPSK